MGNESPDSTKAGMGHEGKPEAPGVSACRTGCDSKPVCGLIMPISTIGDCSSSHWDEVRYILMDAVEKAGFECRMVSDDSGVGVIQNRIVKNIYHSDIIVCDVSHKNPNVMFELGMRIAFDRPVVIVKDDATDYSFDTSPVEHIGYPRDLRFSKILKFKEELSSKLKSTFESSKEDGYSPYLVHFGQVNVAKIENKEVPIMNFLENLRDDFRLDVMRIHKSMNRIEERILFLEDSKPNMVLFESRGGSDFDSCSTDNNEYRKKGLGKETYITYQKTIKK